MRFAVLVVTVQCHVVACVANPNLSTAHVNGINQAKARYLDEMIDDLTSGGLDCLPVPLDPCACAFFQSVDGQPCGWSTAQQRCVKWGWTDCAECPRRFGCDATCEDNSTGAIAAISAMFGTTALPSNLCAVLQGLIGHARMCLFELSRAITGRFCNRTCGFCPVGNLLCADDLVGWKNFIQESLSPFQEDPSLGCPTALAFFGCDSPMWQMYAQLCPKTLLKACSQLNLQPLTNSSVSTEFWSWRLKLLQPVLSICLPDAFSEFERVDVAITTGDLDDAGTPGPVELHLCSSTPNSCFGVPIVVTGLQRAFTQTFPTFKPVGFCIEYITVKSMALQPWFLQAISLQSVVNRDAQTHSATIAQWVVGVYNRSERLNYVTSNLWAGPRSVNDIEVWIGDCPQLDNDSVRAAQSWIFAVVVAIIVTCGATLIVIYVRFVKQQTATSFHQMDLVYSGPHPTQLGTSQQGYEDFAEHNCECTNETPDLGKIQGSIPCNLGNSIVPSVEIKMHEIMQRLSRGTGEVARWAKTIVVGDAEHIAKHVSSFILASGQSIFLDSGQRFIDDAAEQDKAMIVCGRCGTILASKVALTPPKECFRKDLVNTGMRKESAIAMSAALRDFGVVYVASASGPMAMYLLCVGDQIWEFDLFGGRWQQKFSL